MNEKTEKFVKITLDQMINDFEPDEQGFIVRVVTSEMKALHKQKILDAEGQLESMKVNEAKFLNEFDGSPKAVAS